MRKYLVCGLDSDNYTSPDLELFDDIFDAKNRAKELCLWAEAEIEQDLAHHRYSADDGYGNFYVAEIKRIDTDKGSYVLVWHHAYDGVDFKILHQGTYEECKQKQINDMKEVANWNDFEMFNEDFDFENDDVIDTGNEWEMWNIVKVN